MEPVSDKFKAALVETRVELAVNSELEADFNKHQHLLPGRELSRRRDGEHVILTWLAPDAPPEATTMSPYFTLTGDRIELGGIDYYDAAGHRIT
ncbi:hypothetical protein ADK57_25820 [Streptomyces sp. MMG1533]|uniref:hypothetical protein n=1 Tax=Streptomyces sp. MMG1533 TaxID=1415546 RepID=UPI0006AF1318|nr:hypothetical protein [Streptomyces sp. MMG1533]KOU62055.1 hypothetical protein ADK57_25820 [Streptomyces sp. MMG1533]